MWLKTNPKTSQPRQPSRLTLPGCWFWLILLSTSVAEAVAESTDSPEPLLSPQELAKLGIEQLMDIKVVLASRREESPFQTAAAIFVLTQEDIQRSGLRTLPDLLRLVPGLHVGSINSHLWSISSREANARFSANMLVLMDGRSVYTPLFAGVNWDMQDTLLEDIERIEVIRGSGSALWGANAVTGIINIITKNAQQTQGTLVSTAIGTTEVEREATVRTGAQLGQNLFGRVYLKTRRLDAGEYIHRIEGTNDGLFTPGTDAFGGGDSVQSGFRLDWSGSAQPQHATLQGDVYTGQYQDWRYSPTTNSTSPNQTEVSGSNLLARWSQPLANQAELTAQFYLDYTERQDQTFSEQRDTVDFDVQYARQLTRQTLLFGGGYRRTADTTHKTPTGVFALIPAARTDETVSLFIQDQITLRPDQLYLTIGSKFETNDYTGFEFAPNLRLSWELSKRTLLWGAISRSVGVPSRGDTDAILIFCPEDIAFETPGCTLPIGDPNASALAVTAYELGHRYRLNSTLLLDTAVFYNDYVGSRAGDSITIERIYGLEVDSRFQVNDHWLLELAYAYHRGTEHTETGNSTSIPGLPRHSFQARSLLTIAPGVTWDIMLYYLPGVDSVHGIIDSPLEIPDSTRLDLRLGWQANRTLNLSLMLTNLLDDLHGEGFDSTKINTGNERGASLQMQLRF